jgi:uncharacterized protein YndB with AHSA1/START domain
MLQKIAAAVVTVLVVFVVLVAMQPAEFRVARSTTIAAPRAVVFPLVNDLHAFQQWNPYAKKDPAMTQSFEGPPAGPGAVYKWKGNPEIGEGSMTITETRPDELVRIRLEFLEPFRAINTVDFTFETQGDQTAVTWSMAGTNNLTAKAIQLFVDMDEMVGGDFDKGLADLKALAEGRAAS